MYELVIGEVDAHMVYLTVGLGGEEHEISCTQVVSVQVAADIEGVLFHAATVQLFAVYVPVHLANEAGTVNSTFVVAASPIGYTQPRFHFAVKTLCLTVGSRKYASGLHGGLFLHDSPVASASGQEAQQECEGECVAEKAVSHG